MNRSLMILFLIASLNASFLWAEEATLVDVKELGFSINKPDDWHFYQELKKPLGQDTPSLKALTAHYAKTPVAAISKYPADYVKDINPNVRVTLKPVRTTIKKKTVVSNDPEMLLTVSLCL